MHVYGLTGGAGSGKSTVATMLAARGAAIIDTDLLAHQLSQPPSAALDAIVAEFGADFLLADGTMDRSRMRAHVLALPSERTRLENIFHPLIHDSARKLLQAMAPELPYAVLVVPLLFETQGFLPMVEAAIVVDCDETTQRSRLNQRAGLTDIQITQLLAAQYSRTQRLEQADVVISNTGDLAQLKIEVDRLHTILINRSATLDQG